jgi:hypothetical protein
MLVRLSAPLEFRRTGLQDFPDRQDSYAKSPQIGARPYFNPVDPADPVILSILAVN